MNDNEGKDKVQILGSPLGMYSMLREDFIISVLKDDGSLDVKRLNEMLAEIAGMGANGVRDFFWIDSEEAYKKISPFWPNTEGGFEFNDDYFKNQQTIAQRCNHYNMRYYLSLFDHCGTKAAVGRWNPWRTFDDCFYGEDAKEFRHQFIDKTLDKLNTLDVGYELCNEPKRKQGLFLADTFVYLIEKDVDPYTIILGIDYFEKEHDPQYGIDYREFRKKVVKDLDDDKWEQWLKDKCISPVHNADNERIDDLWGPDVTSGGTRRFMYSADGIGINGNRPNREQVAATTRKVLAQKTTAREEDKVHFEILYGKQEGDPLNSIEGVSIAYEETWGHFPKNYKREHEDPVIPEAFNEALVIHGYRGILNREPDPDGLKDYLDFLDKGGSVLDFCRGLSTSEEFKTDREHLSSETLSTDLYRGILDREPDTVGKTETIRMIEDGKIAERAAAMLESDEFKRNFHQ
ncbi:MAG: DUF4214 domain-containing protein [bacterium]|nr:DUF4214 domain-containing protein [bacterium]